MLTGDHVRASADGGVVTLKKLHGLSAPKLLALAERLVETLRAHRGESLRALTEAFGAVAATPREVRAKEALTKLLLDASEISDAPTDAAALRLALFRDAAQARAAGTFDRAALLARHGIEGDPERALYRDLPEHRILLTPSVLEAKTLVEDFDKEQARALLLSARALTVFLPLGSNALRRLVGRARFLGLLPAAQERGDEIAVTLVGPAAAFESAARYGLAFANLFPELEGLPSYRLEADVRLNRTSRGTFGWRGGVGDASTAAYPVREAVTQLAAFLAPHFERVQPSDAVLVGQHGALLVPDLALGRGAHTLQLELLDDASQLEARASAWPADSRDFFVCYKQPKQSKLKALPPWCFAYRRQIGTGLLLESLARFFS